MRERPAGQASAPEPSEALAALVAKLRGELEGVRTAMRNRAVIEQAKGVLVERLGISPDEGFDHLTRLSQRANVKLVEVAAAIVGSTAPAPKSAPVTEVTGRDLLAQVGLGPADGRAPGRSSGKADGRGNGRAPRQPARPPAQETLQAQHQLVSSRIAASTTLDEAAEAIGSAPSGWPAPATVVITVLEPTGAHRFAGAYGLTAHERSVWQRVPPQLDVPVTQAARDRTPLLITDPGLLAERFPAVPGNGTGTGTGVQAVFAAPLFDGDRVIGSLGVSWREPVDLDEDTRRYLSALALPVAHKMAELGDRPLPRTGAGDPAADSATWLPIVLETVPDPAVVLTPVWADGQVIDFQIEDANAPATELISPARGGEPTTLLAVYPRIGSELLLPHFVELLHTGAPQLLGPVPLPPATGGRPQTGGRSSAGGRAATGGRPQTGGRRSAGGRAATGADPAATRFMTAHASRVWDRVIMVWRLHDEAELIHPQLLDAERNARIGSFRWDLDGEQARCSPQLYRMYYGNEPPRPIEVGELAGCVHEDDLPAVMDAVRRTLIGGEQLSWEFRGAGRLAGRNLRIIAEPELGGTGGVVSVRGTVQDVTDEHGLRSRLRLAEEALTAQRRRVDAELHAAQTFQRTLLPTEPELGATEGLWVTGRCRAADSGRVDGDWYDACALPDGASLLVVGDVAGSGLAAMTTAARLRYAVRAYAALAMSPGEILAAVNTMLCALEPERTATLVVALYEAREHRLRWAAAGQAAPVRYRRDGRAELLPGPLGLPVGVVSEVTYEDSTVEVSAGDRVLLYTDSLVGGRGTDLVSALDVLLTAGAHAGRDDLEAVVSHVVDSLHMGPDADMGAMLVRVTD
jgi:hypothetical protein